MSPSPATSAVRAEAHPAPAPVTPERRDLASLLILSGQADAREVQRAQALAQRSDAVLRDVLLAHRIGSPEAVLDAEAQVWDTAVVDLDARPPDARLLAEHDPAALLRSGCVPWRRVAGLTIYACARPERFARFVETLPGRAGPSHMVIASEGAVVGAIEALDRGRLTHRAETLTDASESCRAMHPARSAPLVGLTLGGLGLWALVSPSALLAAASGWAVLTLAAITGLRIAAAALHLRDAWRRGRSPALTGPEPTLARLPVVSILVPLLREEAIAERLVRRLRRVDYPLELLDICLVVEADDAVTRRTLERSNLPPSMRVIEVPMGSVRTKPRAMNYALARTRGSIIGVWDAEDMPAPDQVRQVVRRFAARGPETACLQGRLDYYNARHNVISRLFTIEYAAWFRVFLPGLERMGLPVPLGGTTLFLRREAIEAVGGWDAHNVTEDADLGLRLARRGYRTEVIETVTLEEANSRALPWIRQRSRWLKGYALTWAVHMRDPMALWRDLGTRGFLGVQVLFLATLSQFALAPLLYLFAAASLGMPHPLAGVLPPGALTGLAGFFVAAQLVDWAVAACAVAGPRHRHLLAFVPLLAPYYVMATLAVWKALVEVALKPFYWDKTEHGAFHGAEIERHDTTAAAAAAVTAAPGRSWSQARAPDPGSVPAPARARARRRP